MPKSIQQKIHCFFIQPNIKWIMSKQQTLLFIDICYSLTQSIYICTVQNLKLILRFKWLFFTSYIDVLIHWLICLGCIDIWVTSHSYWRYGFILWIVHLMQVHDQTASVQDSNTFNKQHNFSIWTNHLLLNLIVGSEEQMDWFNNNSWLLDLPSIPSLPITPGLLQKHTFLHIITQSCLTISRLEDGTYGPTVESCNGSLLQAWILHNYTRQEVAQHLYFSPTDYFL